MKPKIKLAEASLASGGGTLALYQHDGAFSMSINGQELMHSQACASERLMGTLGVEEIDVSVHPQILIGGLGLGFTLRNSFGGNIGAFVNLFAVVFEISS